LEKFRQYQRLHRARQPMRARLLREKNGTEEDS
jgi:hypothetical protein